MSDPAQSPAAGDASTPIPSGASGGTRNIPVIVAAIGALFVLAAAGTVALKSLLFTGPGHSSGTVDIVSLSEVDAAAATLTQSVARGLVNDAKHCKVPLVSMTIAKGTAQVGQTLRIRAGNYVSPYFKVTEGMERIAMPFPAPFEEGAGTYIVEGDAQGAILGLEPTKVLTGLPGAQSIPVAWRPVSPC